jgi:broad specificity phosphatase PhoE
MAARAVAAIRDWNTRLGGDALYVAVSHGDVIKAIVADAIGLHLDQFQRIQVDPCSLTVISYTATRPFLLRLNDTGGAVDSLMPKVKGRGRRRGSGDAVVGGGAGS